MEKQLSYLERQQQSHSEKSLKDAQYKADQAKLQLQSDLLETQRLLGEKKQALEEAKGASPLNTQTIVTLAGEVDGLEKGVEYLKNLSKELFPVLTGQQ